MKLCFLSSLALAAGFLAGTSVQAQSVDVSNAWVRSTVPGQKGSGAFMTLTAKAGTRLVGITSPVAGVAEVHEMKMEGDVMKMRALDGLDLPAGKPVELKPGGYHLMLMELKMPLAIGTTVLVTLTLKDASGTESRQSLSLPVSAVAPRASAHAGPVGPNASKH